MNGAAIVGPTWPYPGENAYYPGASTDPVRANAPYTPVNLVDPTKAPTVPILGVLAIAGAVLLLEHFRHKGRR